MLVNFQTPLDNRSILTYNFYRLLLKGTAVEKKLTRRLTEADTVRRQA